MTAQTQDAQTPRVVLVTGGNRGIGRSIAEAFRAQGDQVVVTYRSGEAPEGVDAVRCDVSDTESVDAAFTEIEKTWGPVDVVVANAGITQDTLLMRMKDEDWQAILDTNLTSVYRSSKAVMRGMMKARKGRIVNIASVIGVTGNAGQANYAAAKAGIIAFSKSLAKEIGSRGVTVNVVAPGFINTDMTKDLPEDAKTAMLGQIALGRLGDPADIARAVAFLAGPSASYITGETLHVNGGMYMP